MKFIVYILSAVYSWKNLCVEEPGAVEVSAGAAVRSEEIGWRKHAVEVGQPFSTHHVGTLSLVGAVGAVVHAVTAQCRGQAAGRLGEAALQCTRGTQAGPGGRGRAYAVPLVCVVSAFVQAVTAPRAWHTLPITTQILITLTAALSQTTCRENINTHIPNFSSLSTEHTLSWVLEEREGSAGSLISPNLITSHLITSHLIQFLF